MNASEPPADILTAAALELLCPECGGRFLLSIAQILVAKEGMRCSCDAPGARECPGLYYANLVDDESCRRLSDAWGCLQSEAGSVGGRLVLVPPGNSS